MLGGVCAALYNDDNSSRLLFCAPSWMSDGGSMGLDSGGTGCCKVVMGGSTALDGLDWDWGGCGGDTGLVFLGGDF